MNPTTKVKNHLFGIQLYPDMQKKLMQNKRLRKYLLQKEAKKKEVMREETVQSSSDQRIDQDFSGYPHAPSKEKIISPESSEEKKVAALHTKDGEKENNPPAKTKALKKEKDEQDSDGSANAFEGTERVNDDE